MPAAEQDLCGDGTLLKRVLREGAGQERPDLGASCCVHYVGTLASTGETFDSSRDRDKPLDFRAGSGVITGWSLAVCTMRAGELARFTISPSRAYGDRAKGPIPAGSTLVFEMELIRFSNTPSTDEQALPPASTALGAGVMLSSVDAASPAAKGQKGATLSMDKPSPALAAGPSALPRVPKWLLWPGRATDISGDNDDADVEPGGGTGADGGPEKAKAPPPDHPEPLSTVRVHARLLLPAAAAPDSGGGGGGGGGRSLSHHASTSPSGLDSSSGGDNGDGVALDARLRSSRCVYDSRSGQRRSRDARLGLHELLAAPAAADTSTGTGSASSDLGGGAIELIVDSGAQPETVDMAVQSMRAGETSCFLLRRHATPGLGLGLGLGLGVGRGDIADDDTNSGDNKNTAEIKHSALRERAALRAARACAAPLCEDGDGDGDGDDGDGDDGDGDGEWRSPGMAGLVQALRQVTRNQPSCEPREALLELELLSFRCLDGTYHMPNAAKLLHCDEMRVEGNRWYKAASAANAASIAAVAKDAPSSPASAHTPVATLLCIARACRRYSRALQAIQIDCGYSGAQRRRVREQGGVMYANRAQCYLKLRDFKRARADCDMCLRIDNGAAQHAKARYRRALALEALGEVSDAISDMRAVLESDATNTSAKRKLAVLMRRQRRQDEADRKRFKALKATALYDDKPMPEAAPKAAAAAVASAGSGPSARQHEAVDGASAEAHAEAHEHADDASTGAVGADVDDGVDQFPRETYSHDAVESGAGFLTRAKSELRSMPDHVVLLPFAVVVVALGALAYDVLFVTFGGLAAFVGGASYVEARGEAQAEAQALAERRARRRKGKPDGKTGAGAHAGTVAAAPFWCQARHSNPIWMRLAACFVMPLVLSSSWRYRVRRDVAAAGVAAAACAVSAIIVLKIGWPFKKRVARAAADASASAKEE